MKNKYFLLALAFVATGFFFTSCEEDIAEETTTKTTTLTGAQMVPAVTTSGTGTLSYTYNKSIKTLTYSITWSGLTDSVNNMGIYGLAVRGQSGALLQSFTLSTVQKRKEGTYTGNVYVDEQVFKEADLLAGKFYLAVRTKAFPTGEIRGQFEF